MHIAIAASIGAHNLGDELILKNQIDLLRQEFCDESEPHFRVFSYDVDHPFFHDDRFRYQEYFPIDIRNPRSIFRNIKNFFCFIGTLVWSDMLVIGGGGIWYETEVQSSRNPLDQWDFRIRLAKFLRKKIYIYAISIDVTSESGLAQVARMCKNCHKITLRDEVSYNLVSRLGFTAELVDDPVLCDAGSIPTQSSILQACKSHDLNLDILSKFDVSRKRVGLALRAGYLSKSGNPDIELGLLQEIIDLLSKKGAQIILLPHSFHPSDQRANDFHFLNQLRGNFVITQSCQETYQYYREQRLDLVFAERLHSMILCDVYQIPYIALSYRTKTQQYISNYTKKSFS